MNLYNFIIPLYSSFIYSIISFIDYSKNNELYHDFSDFSSKFKTTFLNVFIFIPTTIFTTLCICPITVDIQPLYIEFSYLITNVIFNDIWFYSFHRLFHTKYFYKFHKKHHELHNTIGVFAVYAHPLDIIIINIGSVCFLHFLLTFSFFQLFLITTLSIYYTITYSHTGLKLNEHQIHHLKHSSNYGTSIFMDKLFKTNSIYY